MAISSSSMPRTRKLYNAQKKIEQLKSRSRSLGPGEDSAKQQQALKEAAKEKERLESGLKLSYLLIILVVVTVVLAIARALPEGEGLKGLLWLFQVAPLPEKVGDFTTVLAPFLAISLAIERLLETVYNWVEQTSLAVADILVAPREALDWVGREYQDAYEATQEAAKTVGLETTPEKLTQLKKAEDRLVDAEERLRGWINAPEYLARKRAVSIWFGLMTGLVISVVGSLGMLNYIGIPAPRFIDMLITGFVIGSGPGPMHDLIGIVQGGKNALASLGQIAKGKPVQEAMEALQRAEALQRRETE